jgi:hypothetical protein
MWMIETKHNEEWEPIFVGSFDRACGLRELKLYKNDVPKQKFRLVEYQFKRVEK